MIMLTVVPGEKRPAKRVRSLKRLKPRWKLRAILQGLKLRFGVRIVITGVRSTMRLGNTQIS